MGAMKARTAMKKAATKTMKTKKPSEKATARAAKVKKAATAKAKALAAKAASAEVTKVMKTATKKPARAPYRMKCVVVVQKKRTANAAEVEKGYDGPYYDGEWRAMLQRKQYRGGLAKQCFF